MAETKKVRFLRSHGDALDGAVIKAGTEMKIPDVMAKKLIADGVAEEVIEKPKGRK